MNFKQFFSLLLAMTLLSLLTGCGSKPTVSTELTETTAPIPLPIVETESEDTSFSDAEAAIRASADERRASILNTPTTIVKSDTYVMGESYSGTSYYVSNRGSDKNDGKSPETPFATPDALRKVKLKYGDAIFFERGSVWRAIELPWEVRQVEGLTFSAYGEGPKPAFYGSEENGSGSKKWELHYEDASGKKIWKFYRELTEVATIVLNGEIVVQRDIAYWDGDSYFQMDDSHWELTGEAYDMTAHLPDMWCFPALAYPDMRTENLGDTLFQSWDHKTGKAIFYAGPLYFRCDAGNPGELYEDIEFIMPYAFCSGMSDDQTFDNLCIKYSSSALGSGFDGTKEACNGVVQNCEVGWMGGNVFSYVTGLESGDTRIMLNFGLYGRNGGAMTFAGSNYTIRNNYVHDAFQEGIALETFDGCDTMQGSTVSGNLIERTTQGILLCNWDLEVDPEHIFKDILVEDNLVLDTGTNNFLSNTDLTNYNHINAVALAGGPCANENMVIRNNIFAFSTKALVRINSFSEEYSRVFDGNTYIQSAEGGPSDGENGINTNILSTQLYARSVKKYLGDETGTVIEP